jgi:hypothetical protein
MRHQFAIGGMIQCLHSRNSRQQLRLMALDMLEQLVLGVRWPADQHRPGSADGLYYRVEEMLILGAVAAADRMRLVMDVAARLLRVYYRALDVIGTEMEHAGLVVIDPDYGMKVLTQVVLLYLPGTASPALAA